MIRSALNSVALPNSPRPLPIPPSGWGREVPAADAHPSCTPSWGAPGNSSPGLPAAQTAAFLWFMGLIECMQKRAE